ncbi:hypothetical protein MUK42_36131 [Musa troglodytarum]|uniref:PRA1 family protein n=1 Tax=Musa troglodytarum TaxID=320322 RepID=A0A9E7H4C5_9LILI|nr:hypothetical protein MUK42_36131 [Musa troglodytarum]
MDWGRRECGGPDRRPQGSGLALFPAPHSEFFCRFTFPRSFAKWGSPIKCNLYYYRTNYFILITFILRKKTTKTIVGIGFWDCQTLFSPLAAKLRPPIERALASCILWLTTSNLVAR